VGVRVRERGHIGGFGDKIFIVFKAIPSFYEG
jgi:hypothetical protein